MERRRVIVNVRPSTSASAPGARPASCRDLGYKPIGVDIGAPMLAQAHQLDPRGEYRLVVRAM
jgi:hypothetical protein